jgi:hypothetical protein
MNDSRELKALSLLSGLDTAFIDEAERADSVKLTRRVRKFPVALAAVITALVVSAIGVSAAIAGYISHKENVAHDYSYVEDPTFVSQLETRQNQPIVVSNAHLRLTVDSIISDRINIECHATLEGLDEQGKAYIGRYLRLDKNDAERAQSEWLSYLPFMKAAGADGKDVYFDQSADLMYGKRGEKAEGSFIFSARKDDFGSAEQVKVLCLDWESADKISGLDDLRKGIYDGIEFELPLRTNCDTLVLSNDSHHFYISELRMYSDSNSWSSPLVRINYKNGNSEEIDITKMNSEIRKYDLENIKSVEHNWQTFTPQEIDRAQTKSD